MSETVLTTYLEDEGQKGLPAKVEVTLQACQVLLTLEGHGNAVVETFQSLPIVAVEYYQGEFRVLVFADYESEEPTHTINLSGARIPAKT